MKPPFLGVPLVWPRSLASLSSSSTYRQIENRGTVGHGDGRWFGMVWWGVPGEEGEGGREGGVSAVSKLMGHQIGADSHPDVILTQAVNCQ